MHERGDGCADCREFKSSADTGTTGAEGLRELKVGDPILVLDRVRSLVESEPSVLPENGVWINRSKVRLLAHGGITGICDWLLANGHVVTCRPHKLIAATQRAPVTPTVAQEFQKLVDKWMADARKRDSRRNGLLEAVADVTAFMLQFHCGVAPAPVTPPGRDEVLEGLVENWRRRAGRAAKSTAVTGSVRYEITMCADDLERALAAAKEPRA